MRRVRACDGRPVNDDEWVEKRVADLEVGDDVRDYGVIIDVNRYGARSVECKFDEFAWLTFRPAHARVDVRRPVRVTVSYTGCWHYVQVDGFYAATFQNIDHAEEYAERLRGSADERAKALGQ